ncbi:hypothetical protein [Streptomyces sp. NPDC059161]|uniref:hypothetical protein n=1 Tax=unclassified Streptomyces TaxID=2593676 RepID=UPI00365B9E3A
MSLIRRAAVVVALSATVIIPAAASAQAAPQPAPRVAADDHDDGFWYHPHWGYHEHNLLDIL